MISSSQITQSSALNDYVQHNIMDIDTQPPINSIGCGDHGNDNNLPKYIILVAHQGLKFLAVAHPQFITGHLCKISILPATYHDICVLPQYRWHKVMAQHFLPKLRMLLKRLYYKLPPNYHLKLMFIEEFKQRFK